MSAYKHGDMQNISCDCGSDAGVIQRVDRGPHEFGLYCVQCGALSKWMPKIKNIGTNNRKKSNKIAKAQREYCEMCLRNGDQLFGRDTLEGHHIIPVQHGGTDDPFNISTLCTRCHRFVEWYRTTIWHLIEPHIINKAA